MVQKKTQEEHHRNSLVTSLIIILRLYSKQGLRIDEMLIPMETFDAVIADGYSLYYNSKLDEYKTLFYNVWLVRDRVVPKVTPRTRVRGKVRRPRSKPDAA